MAWPFGPRLRLWRVFHHLASVANAEMAAVISQCQPTLGEILRGLASILPAPVPWRGHVATAPVTCVNCDTVFQPKSSDDGRFSKRCGAACSSAFCKSAHYERTSECCAGRSSSSGRVPSVAVVAAPVSSPAGAMRSAPRSALTCCSIACSRYRSDSPRRKGSPRPGNASDEVERMECISLTVGMPVLAEIALCRRAFQPLRSIKSRKKLAASVGLSILGSVPRLDRACLARHPSQ